MKQVTIQLTEETEALIKKCCRVLYGDDAERVSFEDNLTNFLPDLLADALNTEGTQIGALCSNLEHTDIPDETTSTRLTPEEIHAEVEAVASQVETPKVSMDLDLSELEEHDDEALAEAQPPTLDQILEQPEGQQINNAALQWAKGNPAKEAALAETLWALPSSLWSMARVRDLAERTYGMRSGGPDA